MDLCRLDFCYNKINQPYPVICSNNGKKFTVNCCSYKCQELFYQTCRCYYCHYSNDSIGLASDGLIICSDQIVCCYGDCYDNTHLKIEEEKQIIDDFIKLLEKHANHRKINISEIPIDLLISELEKIKISK